MRILLVAACAAMSVALAGSLAPRAAAAPPPVEDVEIQLYDKVFLKANPAEGIEGKVVEETREGVRFRRRNSQVPYIIARSDIERIEYAEVPEHAYRERAKKVAADDAEGRLDLARFCLRFGLEREAEAEAERAAKADPRSVEAVRILSLILRARYGKVDEKVHADVRDRELAVYERADRAGALAPDLRLTKARLLRELGARDAALDELIFLEGRLDPVPATGTAEVATPSASAPTGSAGPIDGASLAREVRLELGNLALEVGRAEVAARAFAALSGAAPDDAGALIGAGLAAFARGDLEVAAAHMERASELEPTRATGHILGAAIAVHQGDLAKAEGLLKRAEGLGAPMHPEGALYGAVAAALAGKVVTARARLTGVEAGPPYGAEAALAEGLAAEIASDTATAIAAYDRAAEADPAMAGVARVARAQALFGRGDRAAAEESLKEAARAGYDFADVASLLARSRREAGDFAAAVRFARYAADARPQDPDVQYALGRSYLGAGKPDDAEAAFDAALALDAEHGYALAGKARVLYGRGDFAAAQGLFRRASMLEPGLEFAGLALRRLEEAATRRLWRDEFERPDAKDVRNRWTEDERFGVEAGVQGGRLTFTGVQTGEELGRTSVVRDVEGLRFAELRVVMDASRAGRARAGIRLAVSDGEVAFFRTPEGRLAYAVRSQATWSESKDLGAWPAGGGAHALWIAIGGPARDEVVFGLDDKELAHPKISKFGGSNRFSCAVYVLAPLGASVDVSCDEAQLFVVKEQRKVSGEKH